MGTLAGGTRQLNAPTHDCMELAAALALAISIAVDPDALDRLESATDPVAQGGESDPNQPPAPSSAQSEHAPGVSAPPREE